MRGLAYGTVGHDRCVREPQASREGQALSGVARLADEVSHLGWIRTLSPDAPRENVGRTALVAEEVLRLHAAGGLAAPGGATVL